jgi:regulator of sigma E protease
MNLFLINTNVFTDILFWVYALIMFIIVLGVIILLHEGGHFFFAKKAGILCHEFSIGMGPVVKSKKKGETSYSIRAIPVGGFVSMAGEDTNEMMLQAGQTVSLAFKEVNYGSLFFNKEVEGSEALCNVVSEISLTDKVVKKVSGTVKEYDLYSENGDAMYIVLDINGREEKFLVARDAYYVLSQKQSIQMAPYERCYESKTKLQRFLTVFAGPFMNFVLAFFIFLVVGLASGVPNTESSEIGGLTEGYGAASVLQVGDVITKLNDTEINSWTDISTYLNSQLGAEEVSVTFERNGETKKGVIKTTNVSYRLGVTNMGEYVENGLKVYLVFDNNYVAGKAGLQNGDILLGYYNNDTYIPFTSWKELYDLLDSDPNMDSLKIKYSHDGVEKETTSDVWTERSINEIASGINANTQIGISGTTRFDFFGGIGNAFVLFWNSITTVFVTLGALFSNSQITINELSGPVGIFAVIKQYLATDPITFLSFVGLISANIGLVNLLPLPALDGGRIVFIGYELITKKKVNKKVETTLINIVFWLVMILFVYITFKDIIRLF